MKKRKTKTEDIPTDGNGLIGAVAGVIGGIKRGVLGEHAKDGGNSVFKEFLRLLSRRRADVIRSVLPMVYCLIFAGTDFEMGIYPFGIAAVCGTATGTAAIFAAMGAAVSSLFVRGGFYIMASCTAAAVSSAVIRRVRGDAPTGPLVSAVVSGVMGGLQTVLLSLSGGVTFYEICATVLSAAMCPVLTLSLLGLFSGEGKLTPAAEAGICAVMYTGLYALRLTSAAGESVSVVMSMLTTIITVYAFGIQKGVTAGVVTGLAARPEYAMIYAAAAVCTGIIMPVSTIGAVIAGAVVALSVGIGTAGASAFGNLFPELMLCVAVSAPVLHYGMIPIQRTDPKKETVSASEIGLRYTKKKLRAISESLSSVASVMKKLSCVLCRPSYSEMREMCDEAFDESCHMCADRDTCWGSEYKITATSLGSMAAFLRTGGKADRSMLTNNIRSRCRHKDEILARINMGATMTSRTAAISDKSAAYADVSETMSHLIETLSENAGEDLELDPDASRALTIRFDKLGIRTKEISVYGKKQRRIFVYGMEKGCSVGTREIHNAAESVLSCKLSDPEYKIDGSSVNMTMHTKERYRVSFGRYSLAKRGERSGDSITAFKGEGGQFYTLISDGMGSGGEAAMTSGVCAVFLERLLGAGCPLSTAMEMLNGFLTRQNVECFTTVDLMEADLVSGELRFIKSGAAPSFVLRGGRLFKLAVKTVPMGIISTFDAEELRFTAKAGDFIIMMSDGAVPDSEECPLLYELLCSPHAESLLYPGCNTEAAARELATRAAEKYGFTDDVTVGIVEIKNA